MKKEILWLSKAGVTAGILYGAESDRCKQDKRVIADGAARQSEAVANASASFTDSGHSVGEGGQGAARAKLANGKPAPSYFEIQSVLDDHGTDQVHAVQILTKIRDIAFDASDGKLAVALGRPTEGIQRLISGAETIDGDVLMKARVLAIQRGLETE